MNIEKALKKLKNILHADHGKQREKSQSLKKVLKSLRLEKARLQDDLRRSDSEAERTEIAQRLKVIKVQREKGHKLLDELEEERGD